MRMKLKMDSPFVGRSRGMTLSDLDLKRSTEPTVFKQIYTKSKQEEYETVNNIVNCENIEKKLETFETYKNYCDDLKLFVNNDSENSFNIDKIDKFCKLNSSEENIIFSKFSGKPVKDTVDPEDFDKLAKKLEDTI